MGSRSAVVIGSGIAGAATFFALARRGVDVTLVDDTAVGQATAASAGILQPWSSAIDGPFADLYVRGAAFWPEVLTRLEDVGVTHTGHRRSGALVVNTDPSAVDAAEERVERRRAAEPDVVGRVERIGGDRAREAVPAARTRSRRPLDRGRRSGRRADRPRCARRGRPAARWDDRHGACHARRRRTGARRGPGRGGRRDRARRRRVDERPARSPRAAGPGGAAARTDHAPEPARVDTTHWPSVHPLSHHYLVAFDGSRVAVGATRETGSGFDARVTAAGQLQVLRDALSIAPGLADATFLETRVGLRPLADDTMPIVGAVPGHERLFVATGYGAAGLTMGPLLGDALARCIVGDPAPELHALHPTTSAATA
ncbi:FAD-dependent oxidoreductase [Curtobacterium flaccumfaciens]|nr:FAD-dependent oxidoreductase [Curtobacterium flaccumfaciens]